MVNYSKLYRIQIKKLLRRIIQLLNVHLLKVCIGLELAGIINRLTAWIFQQWSHVYTQLEVSKCLITIPVLVQELMRLSLKLHAVANQFLLFTRALWVYRLQKRLLFLVSEEVARVQMATGVTRTPLTSLKHILNCLKIVSFSTIMIHIS